MSRPAMDPGPGTALARYVGDRLRVRLSHPEPGAPGWRAFLRTNLTRAARAREEVRALAASEPSEPRTFAGAAWRDLPMAETEEGWEVDLPLTEVGAFRAKAYAVDPQGRQQWPEGKDLGLCVHPDRLRSANVIYCAFPRLFGPHPLPDAALAGCVGDLDDAGWTVFPPSGKLRDLTAQVPHIMDVLGCRILHLLPLSPTPTTYARFGRMGSPYAALDLTAIDPALVDFDGRSTAEEQFAELADAVHARGGLMFLDLVAHHTGWGSRLMEQHPDWFQREEDGRFRNPGAWGVTWGDLVEVDDAHPAYWEVLAQALLIWCERGVDGFRCDAGYMVPLGAWQYLQARVREAFPDTVFLLEGLGGAWELTESLLTEGGMQWAYSELFQNHDGAQVSAYLDHALRQMGRLGPLVHYSETHDNPRLAAGGARWSLLRNRLCALASDCGAFGYTCGVEWLAEEKINVHERTDLAIGRSPNLITELGDLARLLAGHPCFFDGAKVRRLSPAGSQVLALERVSAEGIDRCLVLVNLHPDHPGELMLKGEEARFLAACKVDLLGQEAPLPVCEADAARVEVEPGQAYCLAEDSRPRGLAGEAYRRRRAQAAWAYQRLAETFPPEGLGPCDWRKLGELVECDPAAFLGCFPAVDARALAQDPLAALAAAQARGGYPAIQRWEAADLRRVLPVPYRHWVLFTHPHPFQVALRWDDRAWRARSIPAGRDHIAAVRLEAEDEEAELTFHPQSGGAPASQGRIRFLPKAPPDPAGSRKGLILLTNGRGAMARIPEDPSRVASKYDCLLGANLDPSAPCDRHVLAKRMRAWVNADGFLTALEEAALESLKPGPPARWRFRANAGDGRRIPIVMEAALIPGWNALHLRFSRPSEEGGLPATARVALTVRLDLEDRSFHEETQASPGLDHHWNVSTTLLQGRPGFRFQPAPDRGLRAWARAGVYHPEPEWSRDIPHPWEAERGMRDRGDAWSPGWFELPLEEGASVELTLNADAGEPPIPPELAGAPRTFGARLRAATAAFLARRGEGLTILAGFPWFLDWGRDAAVAVRGLVAGGRLAEAGRVLLTLGAEERGGTLPNRLGAGGDRVTSDAPLWFALACEDLAERAGAGLYPSQLPDGRTVRGLLKDLGRHHLGGTEAGVRVDPSSGLLWSPARHTWMDTGYPACTPREGYPIELQALWIRLLRQLARLSDAEEQAEWVAWASRATASLDRYWLVESGWCADVLEASAGVSAEAARVDARLRPNQLLAVALGLIQGPRARAMVEAATRHLLVPGALRSLAPLRVDPPRAIHAPGGRLLNDPAFPYHGHYRGDEDTQRKPAYHNGTAWVWWLPIYAEALAAAWDHHPSAVAAARSHLAGLARLLEDGCLGQLPELLDGDTPHTPRGCDAQAWSASEALRVWSLLGGDGA